MALTTYEGLLETWADGIETVEQNLETLYGPATITPVLPSVTTEDGMLEAAAEGTELAAWNFAKMYNYLTTDSNATRIVDVPGTALCCGQIAKIGGKTVAESGELLSAEVTSVTSKNADGSVLETYPIPAEIQALAGYGWSAGNVFNYIDYERKVFVKNVGAVDLGTLTWNKVGLNPNNVYRSTALTDALPPNGAYAVPNIVCSKYMTNSYLYTGGGDRVSGNITIIFATSGDAKKVYVCDDGNYADATAFKNAMDGVMLYYELATPTEVDISAYITDTDIKVVPGGTLTFDNSNNIDVPSEVKYIS